MSMARIVGVQNIRGLGNTRLSLSKTYKDRYAAKSQRIAIKPINMSSLLRRPSAAPLGLGKGQLPKRKRITERVTCIARPCPAGGITEQANKLASNLPQPKKLLKQAAEKLGAYSGEWKIFLPMASLFFMMAFVNTIVSNLSMSLVITAPGGGAGVIPFLTVYAAFPLTIGATFLYAYASHFISHKKLFTITVGIFAALNLAFAMCLFPNHEALHLPGVAEALAKFLPSGLNGAVGMVRNWTFSIFYCLAEMWGDMGLSLLFWGFANDITTSKQAPILYPLMGIGANIAQTLGGVVLKLYSVGNAAAVGSRFQMLLFQIVGCMVVAMGIHHFIANRAEQMKKQRKSKSPSLTEMPNKKHNESASKTSRKSGRSRLRKQLPSLKIGVQNKTNTVGMCRSRRIPIPMDRTVSSYDLFAEKGNVLQASFRKQPIRALGKLPLIAVDASPNNMKNRASLENQKPPEEAAKKVEEKKKKLSFKESLKTLKDSPIVRSLGVMTIAQALSVTLMEFVWKSHLKLACPTPAAFSAFMGDVATAVGLLTGAMMFLSPILFSKIGWKGVASLTPILMTFGGCAFFAMCSAYHIFGQLGMTHLAQQLLPITIMGGAFLFVLSRGTKFSLFKPSEEIVYINMEESQRTKGKAAVDVVGAHIGKSGGSVLQQMLLVLSGGHLLFITPVMFGVYMFMMNGWNTAVKTLSRFTEEKAETEEKPKDVQSSPLKDINLDEEEDEEGDVVPLSKELVSWDDDRESIGSSVVEFSLHSDLDDYPADGISSHPVAV